MHAIAPEHDFFVGVDSDGCVFDSMELKHKECFVPATINHYELQPVSKFARETWEFVNLYSKSRGINRFAALLETLEWLRRRPEVRDRNVEVRIPDSLRRWIAEETKLGNPALEAKVNETGDADLAQAFRWSLAVNAAVAEIVRGVPPFPMVRESLAKLAERADLLVCSATPTPTLEAEWDEHRIRPFVAAICGQEAGTKTETLKLASQYPPDHALMIGDAPGDYRAAAANATLFYPINPGAEEASWRRFHEEAIEKFYKGTFAGAYQQMLLEEFESYLPEKPDFNTVSE
ncbi:HAD family hydrolase [Candidatus Laterigemmans baculatus]|uniref:HAD family hydrolase n=1 Tax=Candidatus Laterigemmans baculatus TaxID=2770505 RepID=UPI0013DC0C25|nr:HAD family hydrolase [Candidatus Laterigemmans baculatus]